MFTQQHCRAFKLCLHGQFLKGESILHVSVASEIHTICWTESSKLLIVVFIIICLGMILNGRNHLKIKKQKQKKEQHLSLTQRKNSESALGNTRCMKKTPSCFSFTFCFDCSEPGCHQTHIMVLIPALEETVNVFMFYP